MPTADFKTIAEIRAEIEEKTLDLQAFAAARDLIRKRVVEVKDSKCLLTPLPNWSGTDAVLGSLDLSIHAIERTLEDLQELFSMALEQVKNTKFQVVTGGSDGNQSGA